ncbi:hypothetical protein [Hymenobacter coalescens]
MITDFLWRFWVCLLLSVLIVALSTMFQHLVGYKWAFPEAGWVVLATVIYLYGGWPFLTELVSELLILRPGAAWSSCAPQIERHVCNRAGGGYMNQSGLS